MFFSVTNISGLTGLAIIFITAGLIRDRVEWIPGVIFLLAILIIRNRWGEVTKRQEFFLLALIIIDVISTFILLNY